IPRGVHQLDGVERAAALPWCACCVSGPAVEEVLYRDQPAVVQALPVGRSHFVADVTAQNDINVFEQSSTDVVGLCSHQFFGHAGIDLEGPAEPVLPHQFLEHDCSGDIYRIAGVVPLAVSGGTLDNGIVIGYAGPLGGSGDAVDVTDEPDDRLTGAPGRDPRGRNAGDASLYVEPVVFQNAGQVPRGLVFLKAQLAKAEYLIDHLLGERLKLVNLGNRLAFQVIEPGRFLSPAIDICP